MGAILTGFLLFAAFPPLEFPALAWIALAPLVVLGASASPRAALRCGLLAGLVFWLTSLAWLTRVTWTGWFLLSLYCACFMAGFAWSVAWWFERRGLSSRWGNPGMVLAIPALWVGFEYLRGTLFSGFPWNPIAVSQYANLPLIQVAQFGGVYLVSYLVALVNAALALSLVHFARYPTEAVKRLPGELVMSQFLGVREGRDGSPSRPRRVRAYSAVVSLLATKAGRTRPTSFLQMAGALRELLIVLPVIASALWFGELKLRIPAGATDTFKITAVQVNVSQVAKWSEEWTAEINDRLRRTSRLAIQRDAPDLVVWPETTVPDFVRTSRASQATIADVLALGVPVLMGSMDFDDSTARIRYFNSAFLYRPGGAVPQTYAKRHLVLFGEYLPFERWLPFLRVLTPVEESFTAGKEATVFRLGSRAFAVLICFEDTVARLARDGVRAGARLLINQTNDAWFDPSWASRQHMAHCVFRCVENMVPAVRSTNTGITCFIDRNGRIVSRLDRAKGVMSSSAYLTFSVALPPAQRLPTFYTRHGDLLGLSCAAFTLCLIAAGLWLVPRCAGPRRFSRS
ncbi:MAG: apolipoprotein N-acyltransferase [Lentisphaerae bacterium]|nr:apolipoprotein N-acyltransferase [Lentisphaerota bacterium]